MAVLDTLIRSARILRAGAICVEQRRVNRVRLGMIWLNAILAAGIIAPPAPMALPAVRAAREAVETATRTYGAGHPATAMMVRNLALEFEQAGYANYAEYYARQAAKALEAKFGPHDPSVVPALNVLTEAQASQGRYAEAERTARRAVAIGPSAEAHYATALHNLGAVLEAQGKRCEAAAVYTQALAARQAVLPAGHPYIAITRAALRRVAEVRK
jgi:tetratricopeptide (TPR) repeat protein